MCDPEFELGMGTFFSYDREFLRIVNLISKFNTRSFRKGMAAQKACPLDCKHVKVRGSIPAESACVLSFIKAIHIQIAVVQGTQYSMYGCVYVCMYVWMCVCMYVCMDVCMYTCM